MSKPALSESSFSVIACTGEYHWEQTLLVKIFKSPARAVGLRVAVLPPTELLPVPPGWRWGWVGVFCSARIPALSIPPSPLCPSDCLICWTAADCPNPLLPVSSSLWGWGAAVAQGAGVSTAQPSLGLHGQIPRLSLGCSRNPVAAA